MTKPTGSWLTGNRQKGTRRKADSQFKSCGLPKDILSCKQIKFSSYEKSLWGIC